MNLKLIIGLVFLAVLTGCSTYATTRYSVSVDNVSKLRELGTAGVTVGNFTATDPGVTQLNCRAVGPIKTPDGESFETFIRKAFVDELRMAEVYSETADITLTGNLNEIDFSSTSGMWTIGLTINSSNGRTITVLENYDFKSSWYGETACNQTAQALMPAVQNVISQIIQNNGFPSLVE